MSYRQTIYNRLRYHGVSQDGALGVLGNFECESNCEPNRVQGDGSSYRTISKTYTANYMNGTWGKEHFVNGKVGYGLAQWTYPTRQAELWDYWKSSGRALDDAEMQVDFAVKELKRDYPELWKILCTSNDVYTCAKRICYDFENPLVKNVDARFQAANRIKYEIDLNGGGEPEPAPTPGEDHSLKLRTIDKNCEDFNEFLLLRALLLCRGYRFWYSAEFISETWNDVVDFQKSHGLNPDGVVGEKTWNALLKVGE